MMLERLIQDIEKLVERSKRIEDIDSYIKIAIIEHKRNYMVESLQEHITIVIQSGQRTMSTYGIPENMVLVHSTYRSWYRRGKHREGYLPAPIHSNPSWLDDKSNLHLLRAFDSEQNRVLYLDEFRKNSQILIEEIQKGELDDLLDTPPYEILHKIIGCHGELLPALNIDPKNSRIYHTAIQAPARIIEQEEEVTKSTDVTSSPTLMLAPARIIKQKNREHTKSTEQTSKAERILAPARIIEENNEEPVELTNHTSRTTPMLAPARIIEQEDEEESKSTDQTSKRADDKE